MASSLIRIKEMINDLNPSERKIADYILKNPKVISDLSIKDLSKKSGSSQSAVVKFWAIKAIKSFE